jgi:hypothetical protein
MSRRAEHILAGLLLVASLLAVFGDKVFTDRHIFTEVIQDITNIYGFFEWDEFSASELSEGRVPLWNSHNGLGVPHLANMQSAVFFPLNWLKYIFGFWKVVDWLLLFRLWLAGFFLYLFCRSAHKLKFLPAFFAGLSFELCGYFLRYVYMSHLNIECLVPLQLWLFHELARSRKLLLWLLSGAGVYLLITGGFPEASLYALAFSSLYFLLGTGSGTGLRSRAVLLFSVLVFGSLLATVQWLGFSEYLGQAWTYHQADSGARHLDIAYSVSLLLPWFFGKNLESTLVPFLAPGVGTVAAVFCLRAMLGFRTGPRMMIFWLLSMFLLLGLIYGIPPLAWLGRIFPFSRTYNYKYAMPIFTLCVCVLSGFGLEKFSRGERKGLDLAAVGLAWFWFSANLSVALLNGFAPFYGLGIRLEAVRILAVSAALLLVMSLWRRRLGMVPGWLLLFALAGGSIYFDYVCNRGVDQGAYLSEQLKEAEYLKGLLKQPFRYSAEGDILFPNLLLPLGVDELRSYDPLYPRSYVYMMAVLNGLSTEQEINRHYYANKLFQVERLHLNSPLLPATNLMVYSAEHELDSQPVGQRLVREGKETGEFAGWARHEPVEISGVVKKSVIMHTGDRLDAELELAQAASELRFEAGVAPLRGGFVGGGGIFQVWSRVEGGPVLFYARYLNPAVRKDERQWKAVLVKPGRVEKKFPVSFIALSGPGKDARSDYLAWAGLRFNFAHYQISGAENLTANGDISCNRLHKSYPRYFLVEGVGVIPARALEDEFRSFQKLGSVQAGYFRSQAVVSVPVKHEKSGRQLGGQGWVRPFSLKPGEVKLNLRAPSDCFLLASEQYFPGWRAWLDGREVRIYRADLALRMIFVPAGEHTVRFNYQPWSFAAGLWSTFSGMICVIVLAAFGFCRRQFKDRK